MIRHAFRVFNDGALVFPVYGHIASDPAPGSMARSYHSRFEIRCDGVRVFPVYDTVGGATPTPSAGTMARRYHDRFRIYNSPFDNVIVFDAYGVQDTPTPTPTPTGQVGTGSGGSAGRAFGYYPPILDKRALKRTITRAAKEKKRIERQLQFATGPTALERLLKRLNEKQELLAVRMEEYRELLNRERSEAEEEMEFIEMITELL